MDRSTQPARRGGFSLMEIILMMIIAAICVGLVKVVGDYRDDSIKDNVVREELALLNCAIEICKSEHGHYPVAKSRSIDANAKTLYKALEKAIDSLGEQHAWKISDGRLMDPWDRPYVYACASKDAIAYVLLSMGPNGHVDEGELIDDIHSR